jgi:phage-related protein
MLSRVGYKILSDTYHPGNFRLAVFRGDIQPETGPYNKAGSFDLVFECKPQLYLVAGLSIQTFTGSGGIENPTPYTALPNIRVYGYGSIGVGSETITIAETPYPYIDIDCEAMDARYMANNANSYVTVTGDVFPTLPGAVTTALTISGNITKIEIQPRWWTV